MQAGVDESVASVTLVFTRAPLIAWTAKQRSSGDPPALQSLIYPGIFENCVRRMAGLAPERDGQVNGSL